MVDGTILLTDIDCVNRKSEKIRNTNTNPD